MLKKLFSELLNWLRGNHNQKPSKWKIKVTLYPSEMLSNRFKSLMEQSGNDDPRQIVMDALRAYEYLVLEERLGTEFYTKDKETGKFIHHPFFEKEIADEDEEDEDNEEEDDKQ